jgi:acetyl esterase/lipase
MNSFSFRHINIHRIAFTSILLLNFGYSNLAFSYEPNAHFSLEITETPYRKNEKGRELIARIYKPIGHGPFPVILDFHGGAWNAKDRFAEEPMDKALAQSGLVVVAVDLTLAKQSPYPANLQDASYAIRWVKYHASDWNGEIKKLGVYGSSSGGHVAELLLMKPNHPVWNDLTFKENTSLNSNIDFLVVRSPISNPRARYENAVEKKRSNMIQNNVNYFVPWSSIDEANPQAILDRHENVNLKPILIMQGELDDNVLPAVQMHFCETYNKAGGECTIEIFPGSEHEWVATPSLQTDRAQDRARQFIANQLR